MQKRGQLTLFIIVAVAVIAAILIAVFLWPSIRDMFISEEKASQILASRVEPLRDAVHDCVKQVSLEAFKKIGMQAGYYDTTGLNSLYFAGNDFFVVMFKDSENQKINKLPSLSQIENQYSLFLEREGYAAIDSCLNDFKTFKRSIVVEPLERKIESFIYADSIIIAVDWPIKISKKTARKTVEQVVSQKDVMLLIPLGNMWKIANSIVDCETQPNCRYEGLRWDYENWNNPFRVQYITKDARSLNANQIVFIFESIPYRPDEMPYKFHFAIDRGK
ncbi:MAG: hypothetical protein QXQ82_01520 [Candidatus Pacearchaeota archaeon]